MCFGVISCFGVGQGIGWVCFVVVEKVFVIDYCVFVGFDGCFDGEINVFKVFFVGIVEGYFDVIILVFGDEIDVVGFGVQKFVEVWIVGYGNVGVFCYVEGDEVGVVGVFFGKEGCVCWVCVWIVVFDIIYVEGVQYVGNCNFVFDGKIDVGCLLFVVKGCVEEIDVFFCYGYCFEFLGFLFFFCIFVSSVDQLVENVGF